MFTLIENGEVYAPEPLGRRSILLAGTKIARIGEIDGAGLAAAGLEVRTVDAKGCVITPGFIDPHQHIIGAGGEEGYPSRQREVTPDEIVNAGTTTVVGCLGTDSSSRHLSTLLAKAHQLESQGITARMYTGSFQVPPPTLTGSVLDDIVLVD